MNTGFAVIATSRFEREIKKLAARHPGLPKFYKQVIDVLKTDPYNQTHQHAIKKLTAVAAGEGEYRIRIGRFRFRYDVDGRTACLKACSPRREDTY